MKSSEKRFYQVAPKYLVLIAGLVWLAAGVNIVRIGLLSTDRSWSFWAVISAFATFAVFFVFIFRKLIRKHTARILTYGGEYVHILRFFDVKSYIMMAFMMTFGLLLRKLQLWPLYCIKMFYTGLGTSLMAAGGGFLLNFGRLLRAADKKGTTRTV